MSNSLDSHADILTFVHTFSLLIVIVPNLAQSLIQGVLVVDVDLVVIELGLEVIYLEDSGSNHVVDLANDLKSDEVLNDILDHGGLTHLYHVDHLSQDTGSELHPHDG